MKLVQVIVQLRHQLLAGNRAHIGRDKAAVQEAGDHRRVVGGEEPPGWVRAALGEKLLVIHRAL